jgi:hypothetical protein
MKTIKSLLIISILSLTSFEVYAQKIKIVNTKDLVPIAKEFGIDSALKASLGLPIYVIDTLAAKTLLNYVSDYKRYTKAEYFFNQMAHNWETQFLKEKTFTLLKTELKKIEKDKPNQYGNLKLLDDKLIISLLKQNPDSAEELLIEGYQYCSKFADSLKANFPSGISRLFWSFKGTHPSAQAYKDCNENCYKIMWTLGQMKSKFFDSKKLNYHNYKFPSWQSRDIKSFTDVYREYDIQILDLKKRYNSINEIDFDSEPGLKNILSSYDTKDKCWKFILSNEIQGILNLGCQFTLLGGHGVIYKLELVKNKKLKITEIAAWIS